MKLTVGSVVAYPPHGVGRITSRERRIVLGVEREVVVLELADGLSVTLPVPHARTLLRPLASEEELRRVQETLHEDGALSEEAWSARLKLLQEQLRRGDPLDLAAIVRDGARRDRACAADGGQSKLSTSERALCVKARALLSSEIGLARGLAAGEADAWIDEQLAPAANG